MLCVETERLEIGRHQVTQLTRYGGLVTGAGVVLDIAALAEHGHGPKALLKWALGLTIAGLIVLWARTAYARAYTELTADGIRTRGLFGTRRAAWADVADISVHDSRNRGVYSVKVHLRGGSGFRLGAPVHSPVMTDPEFDQKVQQILAAQQQALSRAAGEAKAPGDQGTGPAPLP